MEQNDGAEVKLCHSNNRIFSATIIKFNVVFLTEINVIMNETKGTVPKSNVLSESSEREFRDGLLIYNDIFAVRTRCVRRENGNSISEIQPK